MRTTKALLRRNGGGAVVKTVSGVGFSEAAAPPARKCTTGCTVSLCVSFPYLNETEAR